MYAYVLLCISAGRHLAILYGLTLLFSVVLLVLLLWCLQHPGAGLVLVPVGGCVDCDCVCQTGSGWAELTTGVAAATAGCER